jgi:glycyl-tRNA synthetase beta chain
MTTAAFLVEIGTEELPPGALPTLMSAFAERLQSLIDEAGLAHGELRAFASPRRLAVHVAALASSQDDRTSVQKGPPVRIAFDDAGEPQPAAIAFAKKCGVEVADLERSRTDKGEWLACTVTEPGRPTAELMPELVRQALADLPIPRRMRWGEGDEEFVRPVHWIVMLHGKNVVDCELFGLRAGRESAGHRFMSAGPVAIDSPDDYLETLESRGRVIADFGRRRELVESGVRDAAASANGAVVEGESLYDEVTSLVEWPVALVGQFDADFLELPREVIISTLTGHQRYFPLADDTGALLPRFVTVANIESREPERVRDGNERVIRPRLADAAFFWDSDRRRTLESRQDDLREVIYQRGLGTLFEKASRTAELAEQLALEVGADQPSVGRAARLAKCDLLTGMVGEFPELQGTMGRHYALSDGESEAVATAIGDQYRPRFAGDALPATAEGMILAVSDKLDTLAGIFALGKTPSGNRDPFGLRRAAVGIVRTLIEGGLDIDLDAAIRSAVAAQPTQPGDPAALSASIYDFIIDRLRRYAIERDRELATETVDAVAARRPASLVDFARRLDAVQSFLRLEEAAALAAANKRIANILRKSGEDAAGPVDADRFDDPAEQALFDALAAARRETGPLLEARDYAAALRRLAGLRATVDSFFDDVMVMADEDALRKNRLALLADVRGLFLRVADISRLAIA